MIGSIITLILWPVVIAVSYYGTLWAIKKFEKNS